MPAAGRGCLTITNTELYCGQRATVKERYDARFSKGVAFWLVRHHLDLSTWLRNIYRPLAVYG